MLSKLRVKDLCKAGSKEDLDNILERPSFLDSLYSHLLDTLLSQEERYPWHGRRVLKVLLSAGESVTTEELFDAVAKYTGWQVLDDLTDLEDWADRCVECCCNFVIRNNDTLAILHFSMTKFLSLHSARLAE